MPFALTIFLSAFLLFVVQLVLGKFILPWFGGAPAVWTTCMLFFQSVLLLGYAYAHLSGTRWSPASQARRHLGFLVVSVLVLGLAWWKWGLPVLPADSWKPENPGQPILQILKLLAASVGLPFFLLSATNPLLQRWFSLKAHETKPYRLYALSNAGSLLGLLSYPFIIEPLTRVSTQAKFWGATYFLFAIACAVCAVKVSRIAEFQTKPAPGEMPGSPAPSWRSVVLWMTLAAVTSSMFLSVTNNLCQDVAVVPLLWVVPLAIYLVSFILCFESDRWYHRGGFVIAAAVATCIVLVKGAQHASSALTTTILSHGVFLFLFCTTCHGELARLKPAPRHLTLFYLAVALGGVVGSVFVGLIAPVVFQGFWEFHLTLAAGWLALAALFARDRNSFLHQGNQWLFACVVFLGIYAVLDCLLPFTPLRHVDWYWKNLLAITAVSAMAVTALAVAPSWRRPLAQSKYWSRLLLACLVLFAVNSARQQVQRAPAAAVAAQRNFYGVVRVIRGHVRDDGRELPLLQLTHGRVNHGMQIQDAFWRRRPVGYYSTNSGIDLAFRFHPRREKSLPTNVGVLGLGVGTIAAFAWEGDVVRFYEINPAVSAYCAGPDPLFTYLRDCAGRAEVVMGDARLSLERELRDKRPPQFDLLVMDAFSGDSVPVHLLTTEAFGVYLRHLRDEDAIIAVNISNQYLDLRDLMFSVARHFGLEAVVIDSSGSPPDRTSSRWCLLTKNKNFAKGEVIERAREQYQVGRVILWTDDFSNLFQLLR